MVAVCRRDRCRRSPRPAAPGESHEGRPCHCGITTRNTETSRTLVTSSAYQLGADPHVAEGELVSTNERPGSRGEDAVAGSGLVVGDAELRAGGAGGERSAISIAKRIIGRGVSRSGQAAQGVRGQAIKTETEWPGWERPWPCGIAGVRRVRPGPAPAHLQDRLAGQLLQPSLREAGE
jgi:hypothetical protein